MKSIKTLAKRMITGSGFSPPRRLEYINEMLSFGQWLRANNCETHFNHRFDLYSHLNTQILEEGPVTYLEFGVGHGISLKKWTEINVDSNSAFWGFDSFEGLPEAWVIPKGAFDRGGEIPVIGDDRVKFVKGLFQESLLPFLQEFHPQNKLVVHLDADLYSSTLFVLTCLHRWLVPGTILIFDEFNIVDHEFKAFKNYTSAYMVTYKVLASSGSGYSSIDIDTQLAIEIN